MSLYSNRSKGVLISMSAIAMLSGTSFAPIMNVAATTIQAQIENESLSEETPLLITPIYEDSIELVGSTIYINERVQVLIDNQIVYSDVIDEEGNFKISIEPIEVGTQITIQVVEDEDNQDETNINETEKIVTEESATEKETSEKADIDTEIEENDESIGEETPPLAELELSVLPTVEEFVEEVIEESAEVDETIDEVETSPEEFEPPVEENEETDPEVEESEPETQEEESVVEPPKVEVKQKSRLIVPFSNEVTPVGKNYHYVTSSDTLYSIAKEYKTTVDQLKKWNDIKDANTIKVGTVLAVDGANQYKTINKETKTFNTTAEFISYLAPSAMKAAKENNIYASVILAQAIHESAHGKSGLAVSANNLFGIKGTYNGNSINMWTWEVLNGKNVTVLAAFRLYPSYYESLLDNADKIRNGVTWDNGYYKGAWVENTASHMDATEWLTGRYATDPAYASKLNNTIKTYNLTQYDTHVTIKNPITSQQNINRKAILTGKDYTIFQQPKGAANDKVLYNSNSFLNKEVLVTKEKVNSLGKWWHISVDGKDLGYILAEALSNPYYVINSQKNVSYTATITKDWAVTSQPYGTSGAKNITTGKSYYGKTLNVLKEAQTDRSTYVQLAQNGKVIGWIDKNAMDGNHEILSSTDIRYGAVIKQPWLINTEPYNTGNATPIPNYKTYVGSVVEVTQEKVTKRSTYVLIHLNGKELGWIDKNALELYKVSSTKPTNYIALIKQAWSINTQPWGISGYQPISNYTAYHNKVVTVKQEKTTQKATYALIELDGKTLGWIDKGALTTNIGVISTKNVTYAADLKKQTPIYSKPYGVSGYKEQGNTKTYLNKTVTVDQEQTTAKATYARIQLNGKTLGWVEKSQLTLHSVSSTKTVNYDAKVSKAWSINTQPWGIESFKQVDSGKGYVGKDVKVIEEKTTQRSTYALIQVNGKNIGWIDKGAVTAYKNIQSGRTVNYAAKITKPWSINTQPWGTVGFKEVTNASKYIGDIVEITQEKVTDRSTYALIKRNGKELGWIDVTGLNKLAVSSTKAVQYDAKVAKAWSINTQPWGTENYKLVDDGSSYLGKDVTVVEEKKTERSTYALIQVDGKNIGWIDKGAIDQYHTISSTKDINYMAKVTKPWSINTLPWGVKGYKEAVKNTFVGQTVEVIQEKVTGRSTYALIKVNGKEVGWIDKTGIDQFRSLYKRDITYVATITKPWSINTAPWGTVGSNAIPNYASYLGKEFSVTEERITQKGTYAKLMDGSKVFGWIDVTGITAYKVLTTKNVNYTATVNKAWSINTQPWGTLQYKPVANASSYLGKKVKVIQEKTTRRATYAYIQYDGKNIGWIDKGALK